MNVNILLLYLFFFFSSRRRHTRSDRDWSSDVCSSDLSVARAACFLSSSFFRFTSSAVRVSSSLILQKFSRALEKFSVADRALLDRLTQIGRASCRERV